VICVIIKKQVLLSLDVIIRVVRIHPICVVVVVQRLAYEAGLRTALVLGWGHVFVGYWVPFLVRVSKGGRSCIYAVIHLL
jgi:vacuolar-type H+-ATPase subunit I/STV1